MSDLTETNCLCRGYLAVFIDFLTRAPGGYSHILAIWVCAVEKGLVFKPFTLG